MAEEEPRSLSELPEPILLDIMRYAGGADS
jgi:hypothetical protein